MRIVQHRTNTVAHLAGGFRDFLPDRAEDFDDVGCGDTAGRHVTEFGECVVLKTGEPLACVNIAFPARFIVGVVLSGGLTEGDLGGGFVFSFRENVALFNFNRLAQFVSFLACLRQRDQFGTPNPDVPPLAVLLESKQP
ncbi:hypothetical protein WKH79_01860 [Qipengyuania sp. GPGPB31]|uniref:hypothetical protein n=1 Tax=Qipengyuania sp. GPGPB31 TaxID=3023518 RepID=UPI0031344B6E